MTLITTNSGTNQTSMSFTSGIDSTYKLYIFKFININAATDTANFTFQCNAAGASGYNETMTNVVVLVYHDEADSATAFDSVPGYDQAQGTAYQHLANSLGSGADENLAGELFLFNPSSTTYVKHFYTTTIVNNSGDYCNEEFVGGYINTTTAIDDVDFKMSTGNFDGTIKMYGVG